MDKHASLRAFVAVVDNGGFAAAARALGASRSVVNRQVIQLEDQLKTQLLTRNTRNVAPTEAGLAFCDRVRAVLADLDAAEADLVSQTGAPRGTLKVNAPMSFGTLHLGKAVADYMEKFPDVSVKVTLDDAFIDPVVEGFDVTIRIAALADSSLVARRIAAVQRVLVAAPEFVARHGPFRHPSDLAGLPAIGGTNRAETAPMALSGADGDVSVMPRVRLSCNNGEIAADAAAAGLGFCHLPTFIVWRHLADGRLVTILDDWRASEIAIHALYAPTRHIAPKVRTFIDFLVARFGKAPYWDTPPAPSSTP